MVVFVYIPPVLESFISPWVHSCTSVSSMLSAGLARRKRCKSSMSRIITSNGRFLFIRLLRCSSFASIYLMFARPYVFQRRWRISNGVIFPKPSPMMPVLPVVWYALSINIVNVDFSAIRITPYESEISFLYLYSPFACYWSPDVISLVGITKYFPTMSGPVHDVVLRRANYSLVMS